MDWSSSLLVRSQIPPAGPMCMIHVLRICVLPLIYISHNLQAKSEAHESPMLSTFYLSDLLTWCPAFTAIINIVRLLLFQNLHEDCASKACPSPHCPLQNLILEIPFEPSLRPFLNVTILTFTHRWDGVKRIARWRRQKCVSGDSEGRTAWEFGCSQKQSWDSSSVSSSTSNFLFL